MHLTDIETSGSWKQCSSSRVDRERFFLPMVLSFASTFSASEALKFSSGYWIGWDPTLCFAWFIYWSPAIQVPPIEASSMPHYALWIYLLIYLLKGWSLFPTYMTCDFLQKFSKPNQVLPSLTVWWVMSLVLHTVACPCVTVDAYLGCWW
jgi:hypothetical protein